ncbi:hypothetical protein CR513_15762, partial [Mucuna pruriens]
MQRLSIDIVSEIVSEAITLKEKKYSQSLDIFRNSYPKYMLEFQTWKLEKEIDSKISKLIKQCQEETHEQDLLQMLLEGAKNSKSSDDLLSNFISRNRFIIDNYKIYSLLVIRLLQLYHHAVHQNWQDHACVEVLKVCGKYYKKTFFSDGN